MPAQLSSSHRKTTTRFSLVLLWILASAYSYGFGISELNPLQPILTCHTDGLTRPLSAKETGCIPLTDQQFGLITSLFTLGGLVSSFAISPLSRALNWGRRPCITLSATFGLIGSLVLSSAHSLVPLGLGRFIQGLASGIGVVTVPIFINEISPASLQGSNGVLNQLGIVFGIFSAQAIGGSPLGRDGTMWRWVPAVVVIISGAQLVAGLLIGVESPGWLEGEGKAAGTAELATDVRRLLWDPKEVETHREHRRTRAADDSEAGETQGLLASEQESSIVRDKQVSFTDVFTDPEIRPGIALVIMTQLAQQFSGVNAVLYYSTGIMSTILPALAGSIGILITIINMLMTFPPIFLISEQRVGRKRLMVLSACVMSVSSLLLGVGIVYDYPVLSSVCIVLVVAGFSVGLGPIPFVILPELVPTRAVSMATSIGLTLNWSANFVVGAAFLPLRNWFAHLDARGTGGGVFWIFVVLNFLTALFVAKAYRYQPPR